MSLSPHDGCHVSPNERFLIFAGGSRSGSNAVYYYLDQHPQTCMTKKTEIHFFSYPCMKNEVAGPGDAFELREVPQTFEAFLASFKEYRKGQVRVNISPSLLFHHACAQSILDYLDDVRVVLMLRNPIDKAFSHYLHLAGEGRETLDFEEALAREDERERLGYSDGFLYRRNGRYYENLRHFADIFGDRMKVFLLDGFVRDPKGVLAEMCEFAGIDPSIQFEDVGQVNRSGTQRLPWLGRLMSPNALTYVLRRLIPPIAGRAMRSAIRNWNTGPKPNMSDAARQMLVDYLAEDVKRVEEWLGRPTGWLEDGTP